MIHAVITADIVNSTLLSSDIEQQLMGLMRDIVAGHKHEFFRGDSFQVYVREPEQALEIALLCRTAAISLVPEDASVTTDVRVGIGIGNVVSPIRTLATAKGEAFLLSGRSLDELDKSRGRLVIRTENKLAGVGLLVISDYINSIFRQLTQKQAEVILRLLQGTSQQEVAEKLNKSKSTISQHASSGKWDEIEKIIVHYKSIVQLISL